MILLKSAAEIDAMRAAGVAASDVRQTVLGLARPGARLRELDEAARAVLAAHGACSPFLGYQPGGASYPFPAAICTSVNDAALHGIPDDYALRDGDVIGVDCGAAIDGWVADTAATGLVGTASAADVALVDAVDRALAAGIAAAVVDGRLGDISAAIEAVGRAGAYGVNGDYGGHGVGRAMHEPPHLPNTGRAGRGLRMRPGLVIAIEPWFTAGGRDECRVDPNGWTVRSCDGSRAAHAEHTVAVTEAGPVVLTAP